jgi:DUF1680 family protein
MNAAYKNSPLPFAQARVQDRFWQPRLETNRAVTVPHALRQCEAIGRIDNFKLAAGLQEGKWRGGAGFDDSDVFKVIEAVAYSLKLAPDPVLEAQIDEIIGYIVAAQEPDGFLYTLWTARHTLAPVDYRKLGHWEDVMTPDQGCRPNLHDRWSNYSLAHTDYNVGHMYEAGVAYYQATGNRELLDICVKSADLYVETFSADNWYEPPGHQEVEIGLVKLSQATGDEKYLALAQRMLELRGRNQDRRQDNGLFGGKYNQDHIPVVEQTEAVGHAVRAGYMYTGMADVAALTGNVDYIRAIDRIWENVVGRKLYITGGVGARHRGEEFGDDYELPNREAYCETCAAIANVFWNHRMFLLHGAGKYIDVLERSLYNGVLSGVSLDGRSFFYQNPLASAGGDSRKEWFGCACCPSNVVRLLGSLSGYQYAVGDQDVFVNLYIAGTAECRVNGTGVAIAQRTDYPWNGRVRLEITPEAPAEFALRLRIPGWARNEPVPSDLYNFVDDSPRAPRLLVNGLETSLEMDDGYAVARRAWQPGDQVELDLPMPIRRVVAHVNVEADRGRVALQRGPLVYCLEHPDVPGGNVHDLILPDDSQLQDAWREDLLDGVQVIIGRVLRATDGGTVEFSAIPYYAWAHRGPGEMAVWLRRGK